MKLKATARRGLLSAKSVPNLASNLRFRVFRYVIELIKFTKYVDRETRTTPNSQGWSNCFVSVSHLVSYLWGGQTQLKCWIIPRSFKKMTKELIRVYVIQSSFIPTIIIWFYSLLFLTSLYEIWTFDRSGTTRFSKKSKAKPL